MGDLFPPFEAQKYVDFTPDMAAGAPRAMGTTSEALLVAVKKGNRQATGEQLVQTEQKGCGFCHVTPYPR